MPRSAEIYKPHRDLLNALVCPVSSGSLIISADGTELISRSAKLAFPIREGIPILVISEARDLQAKELKPIVRK